MEMEIRKSKLWSADPTMTPWHSLDPFDSIMSIHKKNTLTLPQISLWHSCGYGWPSNWCPNPRSSHQLPIAPQFWHEITKKIHISKTTGPISTKFSHKVEDTKGQIILKGEVWIPSVSWENPLFVSESGWPQPWLTDLDQICHLKFLRIELINLKTDYTTMISMPNPSVVST